MFSEKHGNILHGILLIALFSCAAFYLADTQPARSLSFSPLILGILLGMLYANSLRNHLPESARRPSASTQRWSRGRSCWAYCWAVR